MSEHHDTDKQTLPIEEKTNMSALSSVIFAATAIISFLIWPEPWSLLQSLIYIAWVAVVYILLLLAVINARNGLLPDSVLFRFLLPFGVAYVVLQSLVSLDSLWKSLLGFVILSAIPLIVYIVSKGKYVGFGTVKILAITGMIVGLVNGLIILAVITVGTIGYLRIVKKRELLIGWPIAIVTIVIQLASMKVR